MRAIEWLWRTDNVISTVLKDDRGKKRTGHLTTLEYLFDFLNAYDFSSEGSETIQEENKTLINASVLGLIFEKINGYKDGSFFTPGFITMYMCRETIRKAFIQKMNERIIESGHQNCVNMESITDVYNQIGDRIDKNSVNEVINNLKICDPAVGSGHFLVSALNEIIALKSELRVLQDKDGKLLRDYFIEVENDELIITDGDGHLFDYRPNNRESQRVQETLFHEKQTIIENCLFGVDINPNSVKICRLRLWIELLKNAYYKNETELETLPNIDINIKCGNSLISRFDLDADLSKALKSSKWTIDGYRIAVDTYRNAETKEQKREMERLMDGIKWDFRSEINRNDPKVRKLNKLSGELFQLTNQGQLFEMAKKEKAAWDKKVAKKTKSIEKLEAEIDEIKANKIYEDAFEWRFEFPEVLDEEGDFVGFDVVIGNPPYIRQEEFKESKPYLTQNYTTGTGTADLYVYFVERGVQLLRTDGQFIYILPNKWMRSRYGSKLRQWANLLNIQSIIDFGDLPVFEEATTYPCIWHMSKSSPESDEFTAVDVHTLDFEQNLKEYIKQNAFKDDQRLLSNDGWNLVDVQVQHLLKKIKSKGVPLGEYVSGKIYRGLLTGLNAAFVIDRGTQDKIIDKDPNSAEIIKPFLAGRDIKRYRPPKSDKFLILFKTGITKKWFGDLNKSDAWNKLQEKFPAICAHLQSFEKKAKARYDQGDYWWELRSCDYYDEFEKEKVMLPDIAIRCEALLDNKGFYSVNTAYIMPGLTKSDLGLLNSKLILFVYSNLTQTIRGGYYRFIRQYLEQLPIIKADHIRELVEDIMNIKADNPTTADTSALEAEIDQMVYRLYDLTEEEIELIEESVG
ncbi:Eco57I restriction-modification methylase domain-containing protein [Membranicola marinus]|uniref:site-specific DNA-methyltransferase (adenine-specific) n=1 Tax=Membranihabitans marinus TaxID=1227546 RepID=A0A953HNV3_9BACT|nr:TaqI-like C-terminal specificity domain-containing protein [Membranihabitans marinus]MBY5959439.1 Eco57I restriction-modification methylase domain-containing protein [Membranihabitans marinus]